LLFVSKYREYSLVVRRTVAIPHHLTGERVYQQRGITADFKWAGRGLPEWAKQQALEHFKFTGLGHNEDPMQRLSFYDTDAEAVVHGWDAETKSEVEELMQKKQNDAYFEAQRPRLTPPWPNYDKVKNVKALASMVADLGIDVSYAIEYERENANREEVIAAFEALTAEPEVEEEVEVTA